MNFQSPDLTSCDREPIHIPGSIQPHGVMLVCNAASGRITHVAGNVEGKLGVTEWEGAQLADLFGADVATSIMNPGELLPRSIRPPHATAAFDVSVARQEGELLIELEPAGPKQELSTLLPRLEAAVQAFDSARDLTALARAAAQEFRRLTGYDRVMVYRFLDDAAGRVIAEASGPGADSFLNHHFPASDIPVQARALYVQNLVRVIPQVDYVPAPLRPARPPENPLDMSDCVLRSVSPVHLQYLRNMGVAASASFSIVIDGALWGLIACHNFSPLQIPLDVRSGCRALAVSLARQIKARNNTDIYRERVRLRTFEDRIVEILSREGAIEVALSKHLREVQKMLDADGVAVIRGSAVVREGACPGDEDVRILADWLVRKEGDPIFATHELEARSLLSSEAVPLSAGLLAMKLSSEPWIVMWFRAEILEEINWAGNPHKAANLDSDGNLRPRASFEAWSETIRGKARRWSLPEIEAAERLSVAIRSVWQTRQIRDLNKELVALLEQKDTLLKQREFLLGEVNHRVQNSLALVASFLSLQSRETEEPSTRAALEEARRRISAVSLVHRRLYGANSIRTVEGARYLDELLDDLLAASGEEWKQQVTRDFDPVLLPNDRAISLGLIVTELFINAQKYAYGGAAGPLHVAMKESGSRVIVSVGDHGAGRGTTRTGFGSRMLDVLVSQLAGTLKYSDNHPGTLATLTAPIDPMGTGS